MNEIELNEAIASMTKEIESLKAKVIVLESRPYLQRHLPITSLIDESFIKRAFAVWGHYVSAQLIISIFLLAIFFACSLLLEGLGV